MLDVGHYINQFFAGIGGEQSANLPPERRDGPVGPGRALQTLLKGSGAVVSTLICGDSFFSERAAEARAAVRTWMEGGGRWLCSGPTPGARHSGPRSGSTGTKQPRLHARSPMCAARKSPWSQQGRLCPEEIPITSNGPVRPAG